MSWLVAAGSLPGLIVSGCMSFVLRQLAPRWGLVDQPGHRKVHSTPVPFGGGIAIWAGVVVPLALAHLVLINWQPGEQELGAAAPGGGALGAWQARVVEFIAPHVPGLLSQAGNLWFILACGTVLMLLGLIDDVRRLDWRLRLVVQFAVAAAIVLGRGWTLTLFVDLPWLTRAISMLWIVGLVNAFNFLDNMDALAGGVAAISATLLAAYTLLVPAGEGGNPQLFIAGLLFLLVGSLCGFLWHNRPPARIFMGDAGSYFIGFLLAVMTILATFSGPGVPRHSILAPLCVLAVPLYDTLSVVCIRLRNGRSIFEGDTNHFSHRLVALGLSKPQAVLTIYLTTAACGLGALVLPQVNTAGAVIVALVIACLLCVIAILEATARRKAGP